MARTKKSRKAANGKKSASSNATIGSTNDSQAESNPSSSNLTKDSELGESVILPRVLDFKNLISPDCVLYRLAPELRKEIFKAVINLFFHDFPKREQIRYDLDMYSKQWVSPPRESGFEWPNPVYNKVFAGLWVQLIPGLEMALFADTKLHGEFIATRIELSTLLLQPEILPDFELGYGYDHVVWPQVNLISPKIRSLVRSVTYMVEVNYSWDTRGQEIEEDESEGVVGSDDYNRMGKLGNEVTKLLGKLSSASGGGASRAAPLQPKSGCELLPLLEKLVIRFPNSTRDGRGQSYKIFPVKEINHFLGALKRFVNTAHIKTFQLEDLRDFKQKYNPEFGEHKPLGLMGDDGRRFRKLTDFLDKVFGFVCEDETEVYKEDIGGRGEGWEIYRAKESWSASGNFLVWNK